MKTNRKKNKIAAEITLMKNTKKKFRNYQL